MGLFDKRDRRKRGRDEFVSPVEQIDLSNAAPLTTPSESPKTLTSPPNVPPSPPAQPALETPGTGRANAAIPAARPLAPAPAPAAREQALPVASYGIDKAIELMRTLPSDNIELVVQVVKQTLESMQIKITDIIADATRKQELVQDRLEVLRGEIADLEKEIAIRQKEIEDLNADYKETNTVRKHLELAENLCKNSAGNGKNSNKMRTNNAVSPARPGNAAGSSSSPSRPGKIMPRAGNPPPPASSSAKK